MSMKTIKARIRVAVWPDGRWTAYGSEGELAEQTHRVLIEEEPGNYSICYVTADLPVQAEVTGAVE